MFTQAMLNNKTFNEKGAVAYSSTGSSRLDYYSLVVRGATSNDIHNVLHKAWDEDRLDTLKLIFHKRDCRGGDGEKQIFYDSMIWLWTYHQQTFMKNLKHIPEYGSYKDWCELVHQDKTLRFLIGKAFAEQLQKDVKEYSDNVTLCAKYAPSEKHKYDKNNFVNILAKYFSDSPTYKKEYRKALTHLRNKINIVEKQMCEQDWANINYPSVPSRALKRYSKAFEKHNPCGYREWLDNVTNGKEKINAGQLHPHEIAQEYLSQGFAKSTSFGPNQLVEAQWKELLKSLNGLDFTKVLAMPDMSGSMWGTPMNVAATLGIATAKMAASQGGKFGNLVITFSESPSFIHLTQDTLHGCVQTLFKNNLSAGLSTNLYGALEIVLKKAMANDLPPDEFPEKLIIFTDMQFDEATRNRDMMQTLAALFEKTPYSVPHIVCWNLRNVDNSAATSSTPGVSLVSGFSKDTFERILNNESFTPYDTMRLAIDNSRYDILVV